MPYDIPSLRLILEQSANATDAEKMEAYMKGHFKFFGIKAPIRSKIQKAWLNEQKPNQGDYWQMMSDLWQEEEREFQLVAVDLLKKRSKKAYVQEDWIHLQYFIETKSWWDTVDLIASNAVGRYFECFPDMIPAITEQWMESNNMWLQRSCLIFQLKYKERTDADLLEQFIIRLNPNREFFIQKAIGWSLRQYSKFDSLWVREIIDKHQIGGLARREASKYI